MGLKITSDCRGIIELTTRSGDSSTLESTGSGILSNKSITIGPFGQSGTIVVTNRSGYTVLLDGSREIPHGGRTDVYATVRYTVKFKDGKDVEFVSCLPV